jgi:chorismate synthase
MGNNLGKKFVITSFGETHGQCIGIIVDGCPAGLPINEQDIQIELDKRKPGGESASTKRSEADKVEILSGVFSEHTSGAPICMIIRNEDVKSADYEKTKDLMRPGHADYTAFIKYGGFNDYRGGGRFSGRNTAGMVMAGAISQKLLSLIGIKIMAYTVKIGGVNAKSYRLISDEIINSNPLKCADLQIVKKMQAAIEKARKEGDSLGGVIEGVALNMPVGLGEPVFDTLEGDMAKALFSIPAVKGVEFGAGFAVADISGSQNNDAFSLKRGKVITETNNSGGVLGGISNGMPLLLRVAVKPTPSISKKQPTVNIATRETEDLEIKGRHDICIVPRAVPVVSAMMAVTLCDFALQANLIPGVIK